MPWLDEPTSDAPSDGELPAVTVTQERPKGRWLDEDPLEAQLDQKARMMRLRWQDLTRTGLEYPPGVVQPPMADEGVDTGIPEPAPAEMSAEDIEAQKNLPGYNVPTQEQDINYERLKLARAIEETLFTPSAAPVEGGKMAPLVSKEVAAVPLSIAPSRTVAHLLGGKYPAAEAQMRDQIAETASGFTNPDTLASLAGFSIPGVKEAFAIQQMASQPEKVGAIKEAIRRHGFVSGETGRSIQDLVLSALMTAGAGHGGGIRGPEVARTGTRFDQVSGASPVLPGGPRPMPELRPYGPPLPQGYEGPGTISGDVSRGLDRRFTMKPEPPSVTAPAPTIDQTLAATEPPPVVPAPTQHEINTRILAERQEKLSRAAVLRPQAEIARRIGGGDPGIEAELAEIDAWLNSKKDNPVVHAPPPEAGAPPSPDLRTEVARMAPDIQAGQEVAAAENIARAREARQPKPPEPATPPVPETPKEDLPYAGPQQAPVKPGLVGTLETKAAEARARIEGRRGRMNSEAALFANVADEAIIGAYHIVRLGRDFAKWVAVMTKELGERDPVYWRRLYNKSLEQVKEEGQKAEFLKQKAKESRSRLDLSKPENFAAVDHAVPIGELARNESFILVDSNGEAHVGLIDRKLNVAPALFDISPPQKQQYRRPANLLGTGIDPKTVKGEIRGVRTFIMYLAAHVQSGVINICKFATKSCSGGCLGKGGMGTFDSVKTARANKTKFFAYDPDLFNAQLHRQITTEKAKAKADGKEFAVRLNGTSDVLWEKEKISGKNLMELHPDVQFYDYTKYPALLRKDLPPNYHITYSYTGFPESEAYSRTWADRGVNTAVVFGNGMPAEFLGRPVIDGDVTDLRFQDPKGVIVGLHAKGPLLKLIGQSEFIYETPPEDVAIPYIDPRTKARLMKDDMLGEHAVDSIKDAAPKAGDLKYKRGNPFLGENRDAGNTLPDWAREEMVRRGIDPNRTFNDVDLGNPSVVEAIKNDPTLSPEQKAAVLKTGSLPKTESLAPVTPEKGWLERKADAARDNRKEKIRQGRQLSGLDPSDLTDLAWILADHINRNGYDRVSFDDAALREVGPDVAPHLDNLFREASALVKQAQAVPPPLPQTPDPKTTTDQPYVSGIANRYRDERIAMGELGDVHVRGGLSADALRQAGLKMPPERVAQGVSRVMHGGDVDLHDAAAVIGEEARLSHAASEASRIARSRPTPENLLREQETYDAITQFHNGPVAVVKQNFHVKGELLQGEHPIDLSTLNGQREQWLRDTKKPMPKEMEPKMQKAADRLATAIDEEKEVDTLHTAAVKKATTRVKLPTPEDVRLGLEERLAKRPCK